MQQYFFNSSHIKSILLNESNVEKKLTNTNIKIPHKINTKITDENWIQAIWSSQLVHAQKMILIYLFGKMDFQINFIHSIERVSIAEIMEHTELAKSTVINSIRKLRRENYMKFENFNLSININYNFSYKVTAKLFDNYFKINIRA